MKIVSICFLKSLSWISTICVLYFTKIWFLLAGDSVGSILAYDALCRSCQNSSLHDSENSILDADIEIHDIVQGQGVMLEPRRSSTNRY